MILDLIFKSWLHFALGSVLENTWQCSENHMWFLGSNESATCKISALSPISVYVPLAYILGYFYITISRSYILMISWYQDVFFIYFYLQPIIFKSQWDEASSITLDSEVQESDRTYLDVTWLQFLCLYERCKTSKLLAEFSPHRLLERTAAGLHWVLIRTSILSHEPSYRAILNTLVCFVQVRLYFILTMF